MLERQQTARISIVHPDTFLRWQRQDKRAGRKFQVCKRGRPRTADQLRKLVVKLARENGWGYTRILGELKKLGVTSMCRSTVKNLLREHGLDPGPRRGAATWDEFLRRHAETLWQCDLISKRAVTTRGIKDLFLVVFLHVASRRVYLSPATSNPNEEWMRTQCRQFVEYVKRTGTPAKILFHNRDAKFSSAVDAELRTAGVEVPHPGTLPQGERRIQCAPPTIARGSKMP